jgi:hypothetical protein
MTIITRSALVAWGFNPDPDVAYVERDHHGERVVKVAEVRAARLERQRLTLDRKREVRPWRAVKLWVAYFDQTLMGGWHAFLENRDGRVWIDRDRKHIRERVMELLPVGLPFGDPGRRWEDWKPAFARQFRRRSQDRKPVGVAYLWQRGVSLSLRPES